MRQILEAAARGIDDAVEARALFQPNAKTTVAFDGEILGRFVRNGPNPWDTYRFVPEAGEGIRVFPGINVQLAAQGPVFRMRAKGSVLSVAWVPAQDFGRNAAAARSAFLENCLTGFSNSRGIGATAFIAKTLNGGRNSSD